MKIKTFHVKLSVHENQIYSWECELWGFLVKCATHCAKYDKEFTL